MGAEIPAATDFLIIAVSARRLHKKTPLLSAKAEKGVENRFDPVRNSIRAPLEILYEPR